MLAFWGIVVSVTELRPLPENPDHLMIKPAFSEGRSDGKLDKRFPRNRRTGCA